MGSNTILEQKKEIVAGITERLKASVAGVFVEYKGITVTDDTKLRRELREAGVEYEVIKNTYLRLAMSDAGIDGLDDILVGTTALALSKDDHVAAARILVKFADSNGKFSVKGGYLDGEKISDEKLVNLSKLPSLDVLLATVAATLNEPIAKLARAIKAVAEKLEEESDAPTEEAKEEKAVEPVEEAKEEKLEEAKAEKAEKAEKAPAKKAEKAEKAEKAPAKKAEKAEKAEKAPAKKAEKAEKAEKAPAKKAEKAEKAEKAPAKKAEKTEKED